MDDLSSGQQAQALTVTQVNLRARLLLEKTFGLVTVAGEVSGHRIVSGHHYFGLKDRESQLSAVWFRREAAQSHVELRDGLEVLASGKLTIYGAQGRYQIIVERLLERGAGAQQAAFEALKARLAAEGLFAEERKRALPLLPRRVAVVTSPTGAVIRDIIEVATRRFANANLLLVPTRVQGAEAVPQIVAALRRASTEAARLGLDVLIVARGGGSVEDLSCFNDEEVARAVCAAPIPVVSAVGHETDFTICDFVADVRAPTPSAAAELVFPIKSELAAMLEDGVARGHAALARDLTRRRMHVRALRAELGDARSPLRERAQRLSQARLANEEALRRSLMRRRLALREQETRVVRHDPKLRLRDVRTRLHNARARLEWLTRQQLAESRARLRSVAQRLEALSPLAVLERGYALVIDPRGRAVRRPADVAAGERLDIRVAAGSFAATVLPDFGDDGAQGSRSTSRQPQKDQAY